MSDTFPFLRRLLPTLGVREALLLSYCVYRQKKAKGQPIKITVVELESVLHCSSDIQARLFAALESVAAVTLGKSATVPPCRTVLVDLVKVREICGQNKAGASPTLFESPGAEYLASTIRLAEVLQSHKMLPVAPHLGRWDLKMRSLTATVEDQVALIDWYDAALTARTQFLPAIVDAASFVKKWGALVAARGREDSGAAGAAASLLDMD